MINKNTSDKDQSQALNKTDVSGSVLIAKYMNTYKEQSIRDRMTGNIPFPDYENWHFLMPVVEKICKENFNNGEQVYLKTFGMINLEFQFMVRFQRHQLFCSYSLLTATYLAVVDYLRNRLLTDR